MSTMLKFETETEFPLLRNERSASTCVETEGVDSESQGLKETEYHAECDRLRSDLRNASNAPSADFHADIDALAAQTSFESRPMGVKNAATAFVASMIGVGVVGVPNVLNLSGCVCGLMVMGIVAFLSYVGGYFLGIAQRLTGKKSLDEIANEALGFKGKLLSSFTLCSVCFGASIAYWVCMWDMIAPLFDYVLTHGTALGFGWESSKVKTLLASTEIVSLRSCTLVILSLLMAPLNSMRSMESLNFASNLSVVAFILLTVGICFIAFLQFLKSAEEVRFENGKEAWTLSEEYVGTGTGVMTASSLSADLQKSLADPTHNLHRLNHPCFGVFDYDIKSKLVFEDYFILAFAMLNASFAFHFSCVPVLGSELKNPTRKAMKKSVGGAVLAGLAIYILFGLSGFFYAKDYQAYKSVLTGSTGNVIVSEALCQQGVQENVLFNLPDGLFRVFLSLMIFAVLFLTLPIFTQAIRGSLSSTFGCNLESNRVHMGVTFAIGIAQMLIAICVPSVMSVLAFLGCGPGVVLLFILPGLCVFALVKGKGKGFRKHKYAALGLVSVGLFLSCVGFVSNVTLGEKMKQGDNINLRSLEGIDDKFSFYDVDTCTVREGLSGVEKVKLFETVKDRKLYEAKAGKCAKDAAFDVKKLASKMHPRKMT